MNKTEIIATLRDFAALANLAIRCEAAKWLGFGDQKDYCGDCLKCAAMRYTLLGLFAWAWFALVGWLGFLLTVFAWVSYTTLTGRGWLGVLLHTKIFPPKAP